MIINKYLVFGIGSKESESDWMFEWHFNYVVGYKIIITKAITINYYYQQ